MGESEIKVDSVIIHKGKIIPTCIMSDGDPETYVSLYELLNQEILNAKDNKITIKDETKTPKTYCFGSQSDILFLSEEDIDTDIIGYSSDSKTTYDNPFSDLVGSQIKLINKYYFPGDEIKDLPYKVHLYASNYMAYQLTEIDGTIIVNEKRIILCENV